MKKIVYIILFTVCLLFVGLKVNAETVCNKQSLEQLAKIIYYEVGADAAVDSSDNFFMRLNTGSIVLNNAKNKSGNNWYEKIYNLTDNNYGGYSSYKDKSFDSMVTLKKGEMLYIASLILNGKYNLPKNMTLQASEEIVNRWGTVWYSVKTVGNYYDVYFGYEGSSLSSLDVFGKSISNNTVAYYKQLANSLKKNDYSQYTSDKACDVVAGNNNDNNNNNNDNNDNIITYNIKYELNGGILEDGVNNPNKANVEEIVNIYNPTKTITISGNQNGTEAIIGKTIEKEQNFAGWESSSSLGLEKDAKTGTNSDVNASWDGSKTIDTYFKNLRKTAGTVQLNAVWKPVNIELPTISLDDYTCKWNTKKDGTGINYNSEEQYTITETSPSKITLYAHCIKNNTEKEKTNSDYETKENDNPKTGTPSVIIVFLLGLISLYICYIYIKKTSQINNEI